MLDNFDKSKKPFKVPENYFESFNNRIMDQLPSKEEPKVKIVPLWKKVLPWTAAAAAIVGVLFTVGVFDRNNMPSGKEYANQKTDMTGETIAYTSAQDEEDYYLFLQDEVRKSQFKEMLYNY
ncbi:MAG TPA: hypothetical protein PKC55_04605 [Dysgonomonas sp.]|uniref:hypothetical protein n=1 Tax=unclassified Dysgonomonas TaxID=2630389 RepID=UPI0025BCD7C7|nr:MULTISPECIES: hypothetical protein [unclassified Dysgonomonas]HML64093.1 hypothetical protein [Dysgonomonas sp.]